MTPDNPRWEEFVRRLEGPEGCDFQCDTGPDGKPDLDTVRWSCGGGYDKSKAEAILRDMGGIDVEGSLAYFEERGGHCDCEILFNIGR